MAAGRPFMMPTQNEVRVLEFFDSQPRIRLGRIEVPPDVARLSFQPPRMKIERIVQGDALLGSNHADK